MSHQNSTLLKNDNLSILHFSDSKIGYGQSHGTFGELLQGRLPNQKNFMVTFPINLFSYAIFEPDINTSKITVLPEEKSKSAKITSMILDFFQINIGGTLKIASEILEGKGLASSSADLVATAYALKDAFNLNLNADLIAQFIAKIEPSDGTMYPGITAFYYRDVKLKEPIAPTPKLHIVSIDEGQQIDTLEYNRSEKDYSLTCCTRYKVMLQEMIQAIRLQDLKTVGRLTTESAIMNQEHNYKRYLQFMIDLCKQICGLGVTVAHSGTFVGILLDPQSKQFLTQRAICHTALREQGHSVSTFESLSNPPEIACTSMQVKAIK